jgi:hypothetical protein
VAAGAKSPPGLECGEGGGLGEGVTLSPVNEYLQRKALITTVQQVNQITNKERDREGYSNNYDDICRYSVYLSIHIWTEDQSSLLKSAQCTAYTTVGWWVGD